MGAIEHLHQGFVFHPNLLVQLLQITLWSSVLILANIEHDCLGGSSAILCPLILRQHFLLMYLNLIFAAKFLRLILVGNGAMAVSQHLTMLTI